MEFTIKNTFIDWLHDDTLEAAPPRRAKSEPPTLSRGASPAAQASGSEAIGTATSFGAPRSGKQASASTASTDGSVLDDEPDIWACDSTDLGSACGDHTEDHAPQSPGPAEKTKLKSSAKAYQPVKKQMPSVPVVMVPLPRNPMPPQVYHAFDRIVKSGRKALRKGEGMTKTIAHDSGFGWTLTGVVRNHTSKCLEECAFAACKQAFLAAAAQSQNVYLLGYEAQPFTPSPTGRGFTVQLAFVENESYVCWDVLSKGCCRRAHSCAWQHPRWIVAVHVTAADSS